MTPIRFSHLVWLAMAIVILLLAGIGWSHMRLRALRLTIDQRASEASELRTRNSLLQDAIDEEASIRRELRNSGETIELSGASTLATATVWLDRQRRRSLVAIEGLSPGGHRIAVSSSAGPPTLVPFQPDRSGRAEILLHGLPEDVGGFVIERAGDAGGDGTAELLLSGRFDGG